jgi:hypothetical protein
MLKGGRAAGFNWGTSQFHVMAFMVWKNAHLIASIQKVSYPPLETLSPLHTTPLSCLRSFAAIPRLSIILSQSSH